MSSRKPPTIADDAVAAAAGRRVVVSVGSLDGPFLAALQRLQLVDGVAAPSTWGEGVGTHNAHSQLTDAPKKEGAK